MKFEHLESINQTYYEHFKDSMFYSLKALKASGYFFIHSFFPDICKTNGSNQISELDKIITEKYIESS